MKHISLLLLCLLAFNYAKAQDLQADTWVATDALGRVMPTYEQTPLKQDGKTRTVGIFYITWHTPNHHTNAPYRADVSRVLAADSMAARQWQNPQWTGPSYHWGEPEYGYFLSQDRYVIRHDLSMLADAGVDVLILDVTNAVLYWQEWWVLFDEMERMKAEGTQVPMFCFWAFNGNVITVVTQLYEEVYKKNRYSDLWFMWDNRPLLLYNGTPSVDANVGGGEKNMADYPDEVKNFFTLRTMWWGYYEWAGSRYVGGEDKWAFGYDLGEKPVQQLSPIERASRHNGKIEQMAVTPAQHPISNIGKSWRIETGEPKLNAVDMPERAYVPATGKTEEDPVRYGIYFQDRWNEALSVDPPFIYLNDWNEWTAGRYVSGKDPGGNVPGPTGFIGRENPFYFVDQYNAEYNRTIQPMRGGYTDNYYMQMVDNIRRYKGVRPYPTQRKKCCIGIDGKFDDWENVEAVYYDTRGDVIHRNHPGYGNNVYTDSTGRNDIVCCKVAADKKNIYFYAETASQLTSQDDENWMLLYVKPAKADNDTSSCLKPYSYRMHRHAIGKNKIEVAIPRKALGIKRGGFTIDFKWADNPTNPNDVISISTSGDTAPNRRFWYRFRYGK